MIRCTAPLIGFALLTLLACGEDPAPTADLPTRDLPELTLVGAYDVIGPDNAQPSGLTWRGGRLYTVSDKHDDTVFRLSVRGDSALMVPEYRFTPPRAHMAGFLDYEGIVWGEDEAFYLVSETHFRLVRMSVEDTSAAWFGPQLRTNGANIGLFTTGNAYLEAITVVDSSRILVAAERQPRGLLRIDGRVDPPRIDAWKMDTTDLAMPDGVSPDFTGLTWRDGNLFVLERNGYAITRLDGPGPYATDGTWSFRESVYRPDLQYVDMTYGMAEGLAIDAEYIYIIVDNNGDPRRADPSNHRPLLLVFERPADLVP